MFKSDTAVLALTFCFLFFPLLSASLPIFLLFAGQLLGSLILVEHFYGKAFRIIGFGGRKCGWVMEQDFC